MFVKSVHPKAGEVTLTGSHIKMSETMPEIRMPAPMLGQHTDEILENWVGLSKEEVQNLRSMGAI